MSRELLASAMGTTPSSSGFRMKLTSSSKYNLTVGGYNDESISLTPLGQRVVAPKNADEANDSLVNAAAAPDIFRDFFRLLNGKRMPEELYAKNMLIRELNVHSDLASECLETINANGLFTGIIRSDGQHQMVEFSMATANDVAPVIRDQVFQQAPIHDPVHSGAMVERKAGPSKPSIFVGFFQRSATIEKITNALSKLGITVVLGDLSSESSLLTLSTELTRDMQNCDSAIVFGQENVSGENIPGYASDRAMWLFLGAATFQFGEKGVLVENSSEDTSGPMPGIQTLSVRSENVEASALEILAALIEVRAITITT
jgi:hypothetical protein